MKLFFFDTETTWISPQYDQILQFWWIFWDYNQDTGNFKEIDRINQYVNVHVPISESASNIHHIYKKDLVWYKYIDAYINKFLSFFENADYVIWHNVNFDKNMVIWECKRLWIKFDFDSIKWLDTMKTTTQLVKAKRSDWRLKCPKLIELYRYLFNSDFDWAHDAFADITATKECFLKLVRKYDIFEIQKPYEYFEDKNELKEKTKENLNKCTKRSEIEEMNDEDFDNNKDIIYYHWYKFVWEVKNWYPHWSGKLFYEWNLCYKGTCYSKDIFRYWFDGKWIKYYPI